MIASCFEQHLYTKSAWESVSPRLRNHRRRSRPLLQNCIAANDRGSIDDSLFLRNTRL